MHGFWTSMVRSHHSAVGQPRKPQNENPLPRCQRCHRPVRPQGLTSLLRCCLPWGKSAGTLLPTNSTKLPRCVRCKFSRLALCTCLRINRITVGIDHPGSVHFCSLRFKFHGLLCPIIPAIHRGLGGGLVLKCHNMGVLGYRLQAIFLCQFPCPFF